MNFDAEHITREVIKESFRHDWWQIVIPATMAGALGYGAGESMQSAAMGWALAGLLLFFYFLTWVLGVLRGSQMGMLIAAHIYEKEEETG